MMAFEEKPRDTQIISFCDFLILSLPEQESHIHDMNEIVVQVLFPDFKIVSSVMIVIYLW